jgi:hypothetical protein
MRSDTLGNNAAEPQKSLVWLEFTPLVSGAMVIFGWIFLTGKALFWGLPILQFVPWWAEALHAVREGSLPLWNANVGMGAPLLANYQLAFFYPPNWLYLVGGWIAGTPGIAWMQAVLVFIHLLWLGAGMLYLGRALGLSILGRIVTSLAFTFSGYVVARGWFLTMTAAVAWLPWLCLFTFRLAREIRIGQLKPGDIKSVMKGRNFRSLVLVFTLLLLAGHAQIAWYSGVFAFAWFLFWVLTGDFARHNDVNISFPDDSQGFSLKWLGASGFVILAAVLAVALAAIQLLPTAEYLSLSPRATAADYETAMTYSFWPWRLTGFLAPGLFGSPASGDYWGYANYWEDAIYIGVLPFFLAILALTGLRKENKQRRLIVFLLVSLFISFLFAFGKNTPIFPFLYKYVPTFSLFNGPTRWSLLGVFSLSLLSGIGVDFWKPPTGRRLYWSRLGTAGAFAVLIGSGIGWYVLHRQVEIQAERLSTMVFSIALFGFWALGAGILNLTRPGMKKGNEFNVIWMGSVSLWVLLDLIIAGRGLNPAASLALYQHPVNENPRIKTGRIYLPVNDEYELKFETFFTFASFHSSADWLGVREAYLPNTNLINWRTPAVNNFDPLVPERYGQWMDTLSSLPPDRLQPFLNLSNVSAVVNKDITQPKGFRLTLRPAPGQQRWYTCAEYIPDRDFPLEKMIENAAQLESVLYIHEPEPEVQLDCMVGERAEIHLLEEKTNTRLFNVSTRGAGWLLFQESWYPGWRVKINDVPAELYRAHYNFMAVYLPEGDHQVHFYFEPDSFMYGLTITTGTAIILVVMLLRFTRKNRTSREQE